MDDPFESLMNEEDDVTSADTVFRDMTMLALSGFVIIVLLLLPWLNIEAQDEATKEPSGSVIVEVFWPDDRNVDVDLWVKSPDDAAVGYSNMAGYYFNLLRDDRGNQFDTTPINYEISYTRGIAAGEYQANLHLYATDNGPPVNAQVIISVVEPDQKARTAIIKKNVVLKKYNQEITVARWTLNNQGTLKPNSVHSLKKSLIRR
ncbi:MAG: hypothetical protein CMP15_04910 [Rickettsiales bacterium]|nr:hypothetical protein [Rickettsiales bacterium]